MRGREIEGKTTTTSNRGKRASFSDVFVLVLLFFYRGARGERESTPVTSERLGERPGTDRKKGDEEAKHPLSMKTRRRANPSPSPLTCSSAEIVPKECHRYGASSGKDSRFLDRSRRAFSLVAGSAKSSTSCSTEAMATIKSSLSHFLSAFLALSIAPSLYRSSTGRGRASSLSR